MAQAETQKMLLLWKTASEALALALAMEASREVLSESFGIARHVFHTYGETLMTAFTAISALRDVECVWRSGVLQFQWRSKTGNARRLIHAIILEHVKELLSKPVGVT